MKTINIKEKAQKIISKGKLLWVVLFSFIFSLTGLWSSCAIGYHTPYEGYEIVEPEFYGGVIIDPWDYHWRREHHEWIEQHPNWRHDYRNYRGGFYRKHDEKHH